jgi:AhpD family alkylhydroperoxidase
MAACRPGADRFTSLAKKESMMHEERFPHHTAERAPLGAQTAFGLAESAFGMVPNLTRTMATSPALAEAYLRLASIFESSSLSPVERQVVLLTVSRYNGCTYCVGAHSWLADQVGVPDPVIRAIREDHAIDDPWLETLRRFTLNVVQRRGWADRDVLDEFIDIGFTPQQVLEVVLGVGLKTLSNYTNHIVDTELDAMFADWAWTLQRDQGRTQGEAGS